MDFGINDILYCIDVPRSHLMFLFSLYDIPHDTEIDMKEICGSQRGSCKMTGRGRL